MNQNVMMGGKPAQGSVGASVAANDGTLAAAAEQGFHQDFIHDWLKRAGMLDVDQPLVIASRR